MDFCSFDRFRLKSIKEFTKIDITKLGARKIVMFQILYCIVMGSRFTFGLNAAEIIGYIKKLFK